MAVCVRPALEATVQIILCVINPACPTLGKTGDSFHLFDRKTFHLLPLCALLLCYKKCADPDTDGCLYLNLYNKNWDCNLTSERPWCTYIYIICETFSFWYVFPEHRWTYMIDICYWKFSILRSMYDVCKWFIVLFSSPPTAKSCFCYYLGIPGVFKLHINFCRV